MADRATTLPILGTVRSARISPPTRQGLLRGLVVYRWVTWGWFAAVFIWEVIQRNGRGAIDPNIANPEAGLTLVVAALAGTATATVLFRRQPDLLLTPWAILPELALGALLLIADVWVYGFANHSQSLPSVWVVAGVFTVAIAAGQRPAVIAGAGLGLARYLGWIPFAESNEGVYSLSRIAAWALLIMSGWLAGYLLTKLEEADRSISAYRAREEVARTLHDGVLQTLAVIQRRSEDSELVELARSQELELRDYLFGGAEIDADLASGLRAAARRAEDRYGLRVEVITAPDLPTGSEREIHAVCGAVGEALTNASKHGDATKVTVYAEPELGSDASIFVSIKDDGRGFDNATVPEGQGLRRSIRGRLTDLGGRVEVDGRAGRGAEIRLWL